MPPETKTAAPRIAMLKLIQPVQFLGISGSQIAPTMAGGLELSETTKGVVVSSPAHKGKRFVIFNANIAHIEYRDTEEDK